MLETDKYHKTRAGMLSKVDLLRILGIKKYALNNPVHQSELPSQVEDMPKMLRNYAIRTSGNLGLIFTKEYADGHTFLHLSISHLERYPTWDEIVAFRSIFFEDNMTVVQILPTADKYINVHKNCFHLWHCIDGSDYNKL